MAKKSVMLIIVLISLLALLPACKISGTSPNYVPPVAPTPVAPAVPTSQPVTVPVAPAPPTIAPPAPAPTVEAAVPLPPPAPTPVKERKIYPSPTTYNGYVFTRSGDVWQTIVEENGKKVTMDFHYVPQEVESIPVLGNVKDILYTSEVYVTFDPKEEEFKHVALTAADISMHLATVYSIKPVASCTSDDPAACQTRPEKDCDDENVIYIKQASDAMVLQRNSCVQVQGYEEDLLKAMTKMFMIWYGIMV